MRKMSRSRVGAARRKPGPSRLPADARRRQILELAARVLTEHGVERVQIKEIAKLAGVSRPAVYRLFPARQDLVLAILEDFEAELGARFRDALVQTMPGSLAEITRAFVDACCDVIETKGTGPWHLLDARGAADPEVASLGLAIHERMVEPWYARIAATTGLDRARVRMLARVVVAAGRAVLDGWIEGHSSRARAADDATRAMTCLLREFAHSGAPARDDSVKARSPSRSARGGNTARRT